MNVVEDYACLLVRGDEATLLSADIDQSINNSLDHSFDHSSNKSLIDRALVQRNTKPFNHSNLSLINQ